MLPNIGRKRGQEIIIALVEKKSIMMSIDILFYEKKYLTT